MGETTASETNESKMGSYSISSSSSSSSSRVSTSDLNTKLKELLLTALKTDKPRLCREFYLPQHIALSGQYYPRYRVTGSSQTGSTHVCYLARPYYSYNIPS